MPVPNHRVPVAKKGEFLKVLGALPKPLTLKFQGLPTQFKFQPIVLDGLNMPCNISYQFMEQNSIHPIPSERAVFVQGHLLPLPLVGLERDLNSTGIYLSLIHI